ncbi:MAG: hypothetical protein WCC89_18430 [Candidatus Sulfotelmatobacter sp.]
MVLKVQSRVLELVKKILGGTEERTPSWLMRPASSECGQYWSLVNEIYTNLTGLRLPHEMPARERRTVDCVLKRPNGDKLIIEVDESQHFNHYRAETLSFYPADIALAFDRSMWIEHSQAKKRLEGGGFARPKPPLFPGEGGRHQQRAFRDALADILPQQHGFTPTLRVAYFEVEDWLGSEAAPGRMEELLTTKGISR